MQKISMSSGTHLKIKTNDVRTLHYLSGHVCIRLKLNGKACNFTYNVTKLHYQVMHPSSGKRFSFLKRAYPVQTHAQENIGSNRKIAMDLTWLNGKPFLHVVHVETNYH